MGCGASKGAAETPAPKQKAPAAAAAAAERPASRQASSTQAAAPPPAAPSSRPASASPPGPAPPSRPQSGSQQRRGPAPPSRPLSAAQAGSRPPSSSQARAKDPSTHARPPAPDGAAAAAGAPASQPSVQERASDLTAILAQRKEEQQAEGAEQQPGAARPASSARAAARSGRNGAGGGLGSEVEAMLRAVDAFPNLLAELNAMPKQVILATKVTPEDAAALEAMAGCSAEEATQLLDAIAFVLLAAQALATPEEAAEAAAAKAAKAAAAKQKQKEEEAAAKAAAEEGADAAAGGEEAAAAAEEEAAAEAPAAATEGEPAAGDADPAPAAAAPAADGSGGGAADGGAAATEEEGPQEGDTAGAAAAAAAARSTTVDAAAAAAAAAAPAAEEEAAEAAEEAPVMPPPPLLARQLGGLVGLVSDYPALRTAAIARGAPAALQRLLLRHDEKAVAANAALALAALAAGPSPHKTALIAAGVVDGLLAALRGATAAHAANGGDAPGVTGNAANAIGNLANGHPAGAAAIASAGGIDVVLQLLAPEQAATVRTNAAGILVQMGGLHESYRAALVAAGGVAALCRSLLRGPDAPACNAALALFNLAAQSPPNLRPHMAAPEGPVAVVQPLLLCMSGRNAAGRSEESVAASPNARVNASAILLELCKDPAAAPQLAAQGVPASLAALAAGRLPALPPDLAAAAAADVLSSGVELLYPVPAMVRGNGLLCLMALARMGPDMQLELGRCGALGVLLELLAPGQDAAMQVNAANAICSLAAANAYVHAALVEARCVAVMAALLLEGGDAARANVCAVFTTMMADAAARSQLLECGGLTHLVRMAAAVLSTRKAAGVTGTAAADPGGLLCNAVGALAEAAKYPELRRGLLQVEFGESLQALLACLRDGPEPAQVNAAAGLCYLCRDAGAAVQLERLNGLVTLQEVLGEEDGEKGPLPSIIPGGPSPRLRHNAGKALERLRAQLAAAKEEAAARAAARAAAGGAEDEGAADVGDAEGVVRVQPRTVWDAGSQQQQQAGAAGGGGSAETSGGGVAEVDDGIEEGLSTVINPPLPLAAF